MKNDYRVVPLEDEVPSKSLPPGVKIWRMINAIMSVFFLLAAYVNLNDSDWYIWVPIYTVPGILSILSCIKTDLPNSSIWTFTALSFLGFCIALSVYIIITSIEIKSSNNPLQHEEGRELSGLLIIIVWLCISKFTNIGRPGGTVSNSVLRNIVLLLVCVLVIVPVILWSLCFHSSGQSYGHCRGMFETAHRKQEF